VIFSIYSKAFSHRGHREHREKYRKTGMMEYWNIGKADCFAHHSILPFFPSCLFLCGLCDLCGEKVLILFQRECFVYEHDGNVVFDPVDQPAVMADELILRFPVFQLSLAARLPDALRTGQNFQKILTQGHMTSMEKGS